MRESFVGVMPLPSNFFLLMIQITRRSILVMISSLPLKCQGIPPEALLENQHFVALQSSKISCKIVKCKNALGSNLPRIYLGRVFIAEHDVSVIQLNILIWREILKSWQSTIWSGDKISRQIVGFENAFTLAVFSPRSMMCLLSNWTSGWESSFMIASAPPAGADPTNSQ